MEKILSKKFFGLISTIMLLFSLFLLTFALPSIDSLNEKEPPVHIKEGNRVYIDNSEVYISAFPHTLTSDGYIYLNITSKDLEGNIDLCFGFNNNLAYPKSIEHYEPKTEITQHKLDLKPYYNNSDYKVQLNYNSTTKNGEIPVNGVVSITQKTAIFNEKNQTIDFQWTPVLHQNFDRAYLDSKSVHWNTTKTTTWKSLHINQNFVKESFIFQDMDTWYLGNSIIEKNKQYYFRLWLAIVPTLEDITSEFLVGLKQHNETLEQAVQNSQFYYLDPWYNDGWQYRKSHTILSASGTGTNYQVSVTVNRTAGTDSGDTVYVGTKCEPDFGDIRFTDNEGETLLDFWIEEMDYADYAVFWIEIADSLSTQNVSIYVYYGNPTANSTSNGDDTFIFFDDFPGSSIDTEKWVEDTDHTSVSNSIMTLTASSMSNYHISVNTTTYPEILKDAPYELGIEHYTVFEDTSGNEWSWIGYANEDSHTVFSDMVILYNRGALYDGVFVMDEGAYDWYSSDWDPAHWHRYQQTVDNGYAHFYEDEDEVQNSPISGGDFPDDNDLNLYINVGNSYGPSQIKVDWIAVRKFVEGDVTHGAWGTEETSGSGGGDEGVFPNDWQYRRSHTIFSNAYAGVNYPVRIKVYSTSGTSSGENVYLNGKCKDDFGDIRFTDYNGHRLLDYWMEQKTATYALFWVEIPANLSESNALIYIYYGNSNATKADNPLGLDLFQIREYDYWSGYSPDIIFKKNGASIIEMDSFTPGAPPMGYGFVFIQADRNYLDGKKLQLYWRCYFSYSGSRELGSVYVVDNAHLRSKTSDEFADNDDTLHPIEDYTNIHCLALNNTGTGWSSWTTSTSDVLDLSEFSSDYVTILITGVMGWVQQTTGLDVDFMKVLDADDNLLKTFNFNGSVLMEQTGTLRDYGIYRKNVNNYIPNGSWGSEEETLSELDPIAFVIWGTRWYEHNATGQDAELYLSENVCDYIYDAVYGTHRFSYVKNFWGDETEPENVYGNVSHCETNYEYTAIFYKGHIWPITGSQYCGYQWCNFSYPHSAIYADEGIEETLIIDYPVYDAVNGSGSATHDFVFLWVCGHGAKWRLGEINEEKNHARGMAASWMNRTENSFNQTDGYANPDGSDEVFISFENMSINFINYTGYDVYQYGHFASLFFDYALNGWSTVNDALDFAAEDTHGMNYGECPLNQTYEMWNPHNSSEKIVNKMWVWGDGNHIIGKDPE